MSQKMLLKVIPKLNTLGMAEKNADMVSMLSTLNYLILCLVFAY